MGHWTGRKVLVTGAGGFIGSHLAERLVEEGAHVRALVHYNALGKSGWLDHSTSRSGMEIVAGDVTDADRVRVIAKDRSVIFHLAALIAIPYSYVAPRSYVFANVEGTLNVLQAARDLATERVVHTSTSEVYGTARQIPIPETHLLQAQSPYAASKIGADKLAESFNLSFGLPVVTVRPFNTFGPRQSLRAVVSTIISQCLAGTTVKLGSLHPTRDLNFVSNTVDGFLKAGEVSAAVGQTFNLGSEKEISIGDLATTVARLVGKTIKVEQDAQRVRPAASEVERLLADTTRARAVLGWKPRVDLEEGLRKTIAWMEKERPGRGDDGYVL